MNNIIILGAGESGLGSALLAKRNKYDVFVSDSSEISDQVKNKLVESGIDFEENSHQKAKTLKPDFIAIRRLLELQEVTERQQLQH